MPEDRHAMGLILPFTAAESAVLGYEYADLMGGRSPILSPAVMAAHCKTLMSSYDVRPAEPSLKSNLFSGGNQQKIVLARELSSQPDILLVGQPTRGVDIGAIEFIHKQLLAMRDKGCAVILVSVELDEIMSLSDRVMVMNEGKSMGIVRKADTDIQEIGLMMAGVTAAASSTESQIVYERFIASRWIDIGLLPVLNLIAALTVAGVIIAIIGENPFVAMGVMIKGAFVYDGALGYTLFYTTNFIFTGLAVAVAFHAMLFNIGGEGQAMIGGLGVGLVVLFLDSVLPPLLVVMLAVPAAAAFGAVWGVIPGWLQARRGSHIVITTIMFNFIASSIMVWLLAGMLMAPGQMSPETRSFADGINLPWFMKYCRWLDFQYRAHL